MRRRTFTLVELMVVIAIVMVLAAIAVPAVHEYSLKAKVAELEVNCPSIKGHINMRWEVDSYLPNMGGHPAGNWPPGKQKSPWKPAPAAWDEFGWEADGEVYGFYMVSGASGAFTTITHRCMANVDASIPGRMYEQHGTAGASGGELAWSWTSEEDGCPGSDPCY